MAYIPVQSIVAVQSNPSVLQAVVFVTNPVSVLSVNPNPSSVLVLNPVSVLAVNPNPASVQVLNPVSIIAVTQSGIRITSVISSTPSSMLVGASVIGHAPVVIVGGSVATTTTNSSVQLLNSPNVIGSVLVLQGTNPWANTSVGSIITIQIGSIITVSKDSSVLTRQSGTRITSIVGAMASSSSVYAVLSSITTVSVLSVNANRKGATIYNKAGTIVYIKLGTAATTSVYTVAMNNDDYYELPYGWTGVVAGITSSNAGIINITELT